MGTCGIMVLVFHWLQVTLFLWVLVCLLALVLPLGVRNIVSMGTCVPIGACGTMGVNNNMVFGLINQYGQSIAWYYCTFGLVYDD